MNTKCETKKALAAKAADANKAVALKAAGLSENATAAEVVRLFKSTAADVEKSTREGMRNLAELAALLVEGYGLTQEQVAEKVGRSQPWVSGVLRWRRDGYKQVAFGPETRSAPKLLAANNPADTSTRTAAIRTTAGDKLDPFTLGAKAKAQLDKSAVTEIPVEVRKAGYDDTPREITVEEVEPVAPVEERTINVQVERWTEPPKHELTPEEKSDDELTAAKAYWREHGPKMTPNDVKAYRVFISDEKQWMPRGQRKAA